MMRLSISLKTVLAISSVSCAFGIMAKRVLPIASVSGAFLVSGVFFHRGLFFHLPLGALRPAFGRRALSLDLADHGHKEKKAK